MKSSIGCSSASFIQRGAESLPQLYNHKYVEDDFVLPDTAEDKKTSDKATSVGEGVGFVKLAAIEAGYRLTAIENRPADFYSAGLTDKHFIYDRHKSFSFSNSMPLSVLFFFPSGNSAWHFQMMPNDVENI